MTGVLTEKKELKTHLLTFGLAEDEDASPIRGMSESTLEKRSGSDPEDET